MWSQTYGGAGNDFATAVVETADGGYAVAGITYSGQNSWLVKMDAVGNVEWNKTYVGVGTNYLWSLIAAADGGYVLAGYSEALSFGNIDFWLVKTDALGNIVWTRTYGGAGTDMAYSVVATLDGGYALAGVWNYTAKSVMEGYMLVAADFWLVKTDGAGNLMWNKTYGGELSAEIAHSLVAASDGGYVIAGTQNVESYVGGNAWLVKTDYLGNMVWSRTFAQKGGEMSPSLVKTSDGGYAIAGAVQAFGLDNVVWLIKTDVNGVKEWNQTYVGQAAIGMSFVLTDPVSALVATADGGYAIASYAGTVSDGGPVSPDFWLVKTDAAGNVTWDKKYGGTGDEVAYALVQASDGGYAMAGYTDSEGAGGFDGWVVKTDELGVVPEYTTVLIPVLVLTATAFILISKKRLTHKHSQS